MLFNIGPNNHLQVLKREYQVCMIIIGSNVLSDRVCTYEVADCVLSVYIASSGASQDEQKLSLQSVAACC